MKKRPMKLRIIMFNFIRLIGISFIIVLFVMLYIYNSSLSVAKEQLLKSNEKNVEMLNVSMDAVVNQMDRMAAALCVDSDAALFYGKQSPERADEDLWNRLTAKLKTYSFGIEYIDSIILYSSAYNRMISDSTADFNVAPIDMDIAKNKSGYDTDWIDCLDELNDEEIILKIRAVNNSYPHVLTLMKQYHRLGDVRTVVMNLDLRYLYSALWTSDSDETQVFVLDGEGNIIVSKGKTELYENREEYPALDNFTLSNDSKSFLVDSSGTPYTYAQQYNEDYDMYFVAITVLNNYRELVLREQMQVFIIFILSMSLLGMLILVYSIFSFKPFGRIIELLENPKRFMEKDADGIDQIDEIVNKIVYHLQVNEDLSAALNSRLELLKETQIHALQSQLNPHFIYNSLDAVGMLAEEIEGEQGKIAIMVQSLVEILRYSISGRELVPFRTEQEYLQKYLYILKCRYNDSFKVVFDFAENLSEAMTPRLVIQPLIENAVFHGIMGRKEEGGGRLTIRAKTIPYSFGKNGIEQDAVQITVEDNGQGMAPEELEKLKSSINISEHMATKHIGVQNTVKRLCLLFPEQVYIDIQSECMVGTCITLIFPKVIMEDEK